MFETIAVLLVLVNPANGLEDHTPAVIESDRNWPQWRGPRCNGFSSTADPPISWSETSNIKWKVKIPGSGASTPVVWNDRVFLLTAIPVEQSGKIKQPAATGARTQGGGPGGPSVGADTAYKFTLLCLDRSTGKTLWQRVAREEVPHEGHHPDHGFASYSAVTDGKLVFAYFGSRGLHCFDVQGNPKWSKDLGRMKTRYGYGEGSSPALFGDTIVINWDHEGDDFIAAFDKVTGKEKWKTARDEPTSWATPLIVQNGASAEVIAAATGKIRSYDLSTGKLRWECAGLSTNAIPSPVSADGLVFATSGYRGSAMLAIRLGRTGDLTGTDAIAWTRNRSTPYVPSPLLYGDRIYYLASNNGILTCVDAKSGQALIDAERIEGLPGVYASPVGAAGKVYLTGRNGTTVVIKRTDKLEVISTNKLDDGFEASPALAGKELFLRGHEYLYCIAEKH